MLPVAKLFQQMGFKIYGTEGTSDLFNKQGVVCERLFKVSSNQKPNILDAIMEKKVDLIVNIPKHYGQMLVTDGYLIRRKSIDMNIPLITNVLVAKIMAEARNGRFVERKFTRGQQAQVLDFFQRAL